MEERHVFACNKCPSTFDEVNKLADHHCEAHAVLCEYCRKKFSTAAILFDHISQHHQFKCGSCISGSFDSLAALTVHKNATHVARCPICHVDFFNNTQLDEHVRKSHTFPCEKCPGAKFESDEALTQHQTKFHNIRCSKCDRLFGDLGLLLMHLERAHRVKCSECDALFESVEELTKHHASAHKSVKLAKQPHGGQGLIGSFCSMSLQ